MVRGLCSTLKEKAETVEAALNQARADQNNNSDLDNMRLQQYRVGLSVSGGGETLEHCHRLW